MLGKAELVGCEAVWADTDGLSKQRKFRDTMTDSQTFRAAINGGAQGVRGLADILRETAGAPGSRVIFPISAYALVGLTR